VALAALAGFDPYDALRGARVPAWIRSRPRLRQAATQVRRRLPFEIGPLLGVAPFTMAKTVGCYLMAAARRGGVVSLPDGSETTIPALLGALVACEGALGDGRYGYEFDVQTRWAYYPKGTPNLIATYFVGRGLMEAGLATGDDEAIEQGIAAARFAAEELLAEGDGGTYFRYTPSSSTLVHNANCLGAGLCAGAGALAGDAGLVELARCAALTSVTAQRQDGSWAYGESDALGWTDSFHTAYTLDGLALVERATGDAQIGSSIKRGAADWAAHFFGSDGTARYYRDRVRPLDVHAASSAIDVGSRLAATGALDPALVRRVENWARALYIDASGRPIHRVGRIVRDKRRFPRWNEAHWAMGEASLMALDSGRANALEAWVGEAVRDG